MTYTQKEQSNINLIMAMYENVLCPMDSTAVDRFISPDYIQHSPSAAPGRESLKDFLDFIKKESPEAAHNIKKCFADDDHVIVYTHVQRSPTDTGFAVIDIYRIEEGMLVEHWDISQDVPTNSPNPNSMF